jgi:hypothetical protein
MSNVDSRAPVTAHKIGESNALVQEALTTHYHHTSSPHIITTHYHHTLSPHIINCIGTYFCLKHGQIKMHPHQYIKGLQDLFPLVSFIVCVRI